MLKNYKSDSPLPNIFAAIEKTLVGHGAKQINREYTNDGLIKSISFVVDTPKGEMGIKLPARWERVRKLFDDEGVRYKPDQPYRTAWATIRDWVSAQMALIDWDMVKLEEVFLPYGQTKTGETFFEVIERKGFELESGTKEPEEGVVE